MNFNKIALVTGLVGIGTLPLLAIAKPVNAALMNYSVEYDPVSKISIFNNSSDSLESLRTFSSIINPNSLGGAYNPVYISPGDSIKFFADGSYTLIDNPPSNPVSIEPEYKNGKVQPDKEWKMSMITLGGWKKWIPDPKDPKKGKWEDHDGLPDDGVATAKKSDWFYFETLAFAEFVDSDPQYTFKAGSRNKPVKMHVGAEEKGGFIPPDPNPLTSLLFEPAPPNFFEEDAPSALLTQGFIEVPQTDTLNFMGIYTPNAGAGSVATPEPSSTLCFLALGTLGAGATLKRKLKTSKSVENELEKIS